MKTKFLPWLGNSLLTAFVTLSPWTIGKEVWQAQGGEEETPWVWEAPGAPRHLGDVDPSQSPTAAPTSYFDQLPQVVKPLPSQTLWVGETALLNVSLSPFRDAQGAPMPFAFHFGGGQPLPLFIYFHELTQKFVFSPAVEDLGNYSLWLWANNSYGVTELEVPLYVVEKQSTTLTPVTLQETKNKVGLDLIFSLIGVVSFLFGMLFTFLHFRFQQREAADLADKLGAQVEMS